MLRRFARCFLLVLAAAASTPAVLAQQVAVEEFSLPNGMQFLLVPRSDQPNVVSAGWVAKVGSVDERPGITGISHFFEHMMFKGTDTIGTRDPAKDAKYRAEQKAVRDEINRLVWTKQYERLNRGEIDDAWDPANDTQELRVLRGKLDALIKAQQGRGAGGADAATIVKDEFDQVYTKAGGSGMNAFTSYDLTCYFITVPANKLELWAWMESDRLHDSVFREFYSERDVVHEERRLRTDSTPTGRFEEQFDAMFWMASGYSWPVIGWTSDLNSYTMEEAMKYFNIYYRPNNLCGVVVGDFNPSEVKETIRSYFSRLKRGEQAPPPVITLEVEQMAEMRLNAECDCQPSVEVRYHAVPFRHRDSYALEVMAAVLNGRTGRLYKSLVEGAEIAADAGAQFDARKYAGAFSFFAEVKGDSDPSDLEQAWYAQLKKIQDEAVPANELQKVKNQFAASNFRRLKSNFFLLEQLGSYEGLGTWQEINDAPKRIDAVTAEDIQRVARDYFADKNRSVATYRRKAGAEDGAQATDVDADIAALPEVMRAQAGAAATQIARETDANKLAEGMAQMQSQAEQVPPQMKPLFDFILAKIEARLAELEAGK